jgi:hypothetical protein
MSDKPEAKPPTPEELREKYAEVYEWVEAQPCTSWDFVHVPIESLAALMHLPNPE